MAGQGHAGGTARQPQNAPTKCKIVTGLYVLGAILMAIVGIAAVALADLLPGSLASLGIALALIFFLFAAISFAVAYGLWNVKQWGWYGAGILTVLGLLGQVGSLASGTFNASMLINLAILVFTAYALYDESEFYGVNL